MTERVTAARARALLDRERKKPDWEGEFFGQCRRFMLPEPRRQFLFALETHRGPRRWKFDFAWPDYWLALEVEGLLVRKLASGELVCVGRHTTVDGFRDDCEKYANAALLGWTVLRFEQSQVANRYAIEMAQRVLTARGWRRTPRPTKYVQEAPTPGRLPLGP